MDISPEYPNILILAIGRALSPSTSPHVSGSNMVYTITCYIKATCAERKHPPDDVDAITNVVNAAPEKTPHARHSDRSRLLPRAYYYFAPYLHAPQVDTCSLKKSLKDCGCWFTITLSRHRREADDDWSRIKSDDTDYIHSALPMQITMEAIFNESDMSRWLVTNILRIVTRTARVPGGKNITRLAYEVNDKLAWKPVHADASTHVTVS